MINLGVILTEFPEEYYPQIKVLCLPVSIYLCIDLFLYLSRVTRGYLGQFYRKFNFHPVIQIFFFFNYFIEKETSHIKFHR